MKRSFLMVLVLLLAGVSISACGVKSAPKYSPDAPASAPKKS